MTAELLRRILADPDDRETRLVYADAIGATDPARGELIVVEDRLASAAFIDPARPALLARRAALRRAHGRRWWPELPVEQLDTRGGFVRVLTLAPGQLAAGERMLAREPIARLVFLNHAPSLSERWRRVIRGVAYHGTVDWSAFALAAKSFDDRLVQVTASNLRGSRELELDLPLLGRVLDLAGSRLPGPITFARWRHAPRLEELSLAYTDLEELDLVALARHDLSALRVLKLSGTRFGGRGLVPLTRTLQRCKHLERIEMFDCHVSPGAPAVDLLRTACPQLVTATPLDSVTCRIGGHVVDLRVTGSQIAVAVDGRAVHVDTAAPLARLVEGLRRGRALVPTLTGGAELGGLTLDLRGLDTGLLRVV